MVNLGYIFLLCPILLSPKMSYHLFAGVSSSSHVDKVPLRCYVISRGTDMGRMCARNNPLARELQTFCEIRTHNGRWSTDLSLTPQPGILFSADYTFRNGAVVNVNLMKVDDSGKISFVMIPTCCTIGKKIMNDLRARHSSITSAASRMRSLRKAVGVKKVSNSDMMLSKNEVLSHVCDDKCSMIYPDPDASTSASLVPGGTPNLIQPGRTNTLVVPVNTFSIASSIRSPRATSFPTIRSDLHSVQPSWNDSKKRSCEDDKNPSPLKRSRVD